MFALVNFIVQSCGSTATIARDEFDTFEPNDDIKAILRRLTEETGLEAVSTERLYMNVWRLICPANRKEENILSCRANKPWRSSRQTSWSFGRSWSANAPRPFFTTATSCLNSLVGSTPFQSTFSPLDLKQVLTLVLQKRYQNFPSHCYSYRLANCSLTVYGWSFSSQSTRDKRSLVEGWE